MCPPTCQLPHLIQWPVGREHRLSDNMQRENSHQPLGHCVGSQAMHPDFRLSEAFVPVQQGGERMGPVTSALSATYAQTSATSISELAVLYECPVCRDYALPPILQCENGHHLCTTCRKSVTRCPVCRARKGKNRNLALDRLAETTLFPCKYGSIGCTAALRIAAKKKHEMACEYRPCPCVLGWETCSWTGPLEQLVDHILRSHGFVTRLQGENILITATRFHRVGAFCWFALQKCLGRDFVVMLKKRSNNSCGKHFIGLVALVGSSLEAQNFVYRLQICGAKHRITWEARMQGVHSLAESVESGEGLVFDSSTAQRLCNGTDLIMDVAISAAALCGDKAP
ncbi:hypothetical protein HPB52_003547 [Rhipicephalus sanguineus]|uniref:E3 ubiquitin-protein ligase n=1 Tax=Rhipicephalus sanguineus TaxID=34632 RepID=A0A9D4QGV2_RHISA|nr:hypothetical protein HPB52_003547 [Rhipicephalus sanguineus]